jgi:predicted TIM-barrel fold metal-dependent hydrolase
MIIDSLTHVTPDGRWFDTSYNASETRLLHEMDREGVDKAVLVALAGYIDNEFVAQVCARHSDRLIPGASINPVAYSTSSQAVSELEPLLDKGFTVLKLHPRLHQYDLMDFRSVALLEAIAVHDVPPLIWLDTFLRYRGATLRKPPVETICEWIAKFPSLTFVLLHSGGAEALRLAEAIRDYPNIFLDISYTMHRYRGSSVEMDLKYLLRFFDRRMIFGSDFPEVSLKEALDDFNSLTLNLNTETRHRILGNNLQGLLRL